MSSFLLCLFQLSILLMLPKLWKISCILLFIFVCLLFFFVVFFFFFFCFFWYCGAIIIVYNHERNIDVCVLFWESLGLWVGIFAFSAFASMSYWEYFCISGCSFFFLGVSHPLQSCRYVVQYWIGWYVLCERNDLMQNSDIGMYLYSYKISPLLF